MSRGCDKSLDRHMHLLWHVASPSASCKSRWLVLMVSGLLVSSRRASQFDLTVLLLSSPASQKAP